MKKVLILLSATTLALGLAGNALALHDGGVAKCEACHTMHNSLGNATADNNLPNQFTTGSYLLKGNDPSSACLNCHEGTTLSSYRVSSAGMSDTTIPLQRTPGGDFSWLKVGSDPAKKSLRGHNIIAADFNYGADTRPGMATAPGGTYPNAKFYCSSCHDPHGKYRVLNDGSTATTGAPIKTYGSYGAIPAIGEAVGAYRLLGGTGYEPKSVKDQGLAFANTIPAAVAPSGYNKSEATSQVRVAYGSGMSEWCANCHTSLHNDAYPTNLRHPSGNNADLTAAIISNYNAYVKSGDMSGTEASSFLSLVPFESGQGQADRAALTSLVTAATGPASGANVMCLSCHRAHASGFESMLRWDGKANMIVANGAYNLAYSPYSSSSLDGAQTLAAYYDRPATQFASYQRSLCNKCHAKD